MPLCAPLVTSALAGSLFLGSWGTVGVFARRSGQLPLSPSSSVFSSRTLSGCPRVFGFHMQSPISSPGPSLSPSPGSRSCLESVPRESSLSATAPPSVPGAPARPQAALSLLVSAQHPGVSPPYREWGCSWPRGGVGVLPSAAGAVSSRSWECSSLARCCLHATLRVEVAIVFHLGQAARGVPVGSCPSGHLWSLLVECCPWVACVSVLRWAQRYGAPARGLSEVGGGGEARQGPGSWRRQAGWASLLLPGVGFAC